MKIILDELTPKEFFSNGGVVKIRLDSDFLKSLYGKKNKFFFYDYKSYIRFLRDIYLRYMSKYHDLKLKDIYKEVNDGIKMSCCIGTKEYTTDYNFDEVTSLEFCNFYYCYDTDFYERNRKSGRIDAYGIKNVNFSQIDINDERWNVFEEQRLKRGFDDSELWNLDKSIIGFILPRLKAFKDKHSSSPLNIDKKEWNVILEKMIIAFELLENDNNTEEDKKKINNGLNLFVKYLKSLWD